MTAFNMQLKLQSRGAHQETRACTIHFDKSCMVFISLFGFKKLTCTCEVYILKIWKICLKDGYGIWWTCYTAWYLYIIVVSFGSSAAA